MSKIRRNVSGIRFGRLIALEDVGSENKKIGRCRLWKCICDCGTEITIPVNRLLRGTTRSCGCFKKDLQRAKVILPPGVAAFNTLYKRYKLSANSKKLEFSLSKEQFKEIVIKKCFYCGKEPASILLNKKNCNGPFIYNGIDRADNSLGYSIENSLPCCSECNYLKSSRSKEEFISIITKIYTHLLGKG